MTFLIITQVEHKYFNGSYYSFSPYVKEINLWLKYADKVLVLAPTPQNENPGKTDLQYSHLAIEFIPVPAFNLLGFSSIIKSFFVIPSVFWQCIRTIKKADHIHLRCPGNMGLLGCIAQIFFPNKIKTAKYAGNWDNNSKQPWSYKTQKWILNNTFLTKNMQVLVYGKWPNSSKNILSFFTASYKETDYLAVNPRDLNKTIKLIFVGSLSKGKQPIISCIVTKQLLEKGINVSLEFYGEGSERIEIEKFIETNHLEKNIHLHGNQNEEILKGAYQQAHFLIFMSKSEGWPKTVAEAMWWGCLPVTTAVSCVPEMLGYGERGVLVTPDITEIVGHIEYFINHPQEYKAKCNAASEWSRQFTLDRFEKEIKLLMLS